jgi:hypothetical protein
MGDAYFREEPSELFRKHERALIFGRIVYVDLSQTIIQSWP